MTDQRDCKHGRQLGKCDSCDLEEAERTIAHLRQHKNDYMEAAEQTKKALEAELRRTESRLHEVAVACATAEQELNAVTAELRDTQHELALLHDHYKLYPGAWCCDAARWSNGWNHATNCKNWVLTF